MQTEWISIEEAMEILGMGRVPVNHLAMRNKVRARVSEQPHPNGSRPWEFDRQSVEERAARMKIIVPDVAECGVDWMPLVEAIRYLGLSRNSVCERISKGLLESATFGPPEKPSVFVNRKQVAEHLTKPPHLPRTRYEWQPPAISEGQRGYLAGILDGEGCISLIRSTHGHKVQWLVRLTIVNTNQKIIREVEQCLGGKVTRRNPPYHTHKPAYAWQVNCSEAAAILAYLRPYLKGKDEQADLALRFQQHLDENPYRIVPSDVIQWRDEQHRLMAELNRRGVPVEGE